MSRPRVCVHLLCKGSIRLASWLTSGVGSSTSVLPMLPQQKPGPRFFATFGFMFAMEPDSLRHITHPGEARTGGFLSLTPPAQASELRKELKRKRSRPQAVGAEFQKPAGAGSALCAEGGGRPPPPRGGRSRAELAAASGNAAPSTAHQAAGRERAGCSFRCPPGSPGPVSTSFLAFLGPNSHLHFQIL